MISIRDAMTDPALFGEQFGGDSFAGWRALLAGFYGLDLDADELSHWQTLTGRQSGPQCAHDELWLVVGRRGGKSLSAALCAVFEACFRDHTDRLAPGEVATVLVLAANMRQARTAFRYVSGLIENNPMLQRMVVRQSGDSIELENRCVIEVQAASFRTVRGYTVAAVIADEVAFWRSDESANPDSEIINAIRPAMATLGGKLIALSSPYARRGALWQAYRQHHGREGSVLVAQAASRDLNPSLPQRVVDQAMQRDPAAARAEYLAEFRTDVESFIDADVVDRCTVSGRRELLPMSGVRYFGFVDPSGGRGDAMTLAVAHREGEAVVVDCIRAVAPPFSPEAVTREFAELLKRYRIASVVGDRYGGEWPSEQFRKHGIQYKPAAKPKSELYGELLAALNSGTVELIDDPATNAEIVALERRTGRGGRDSIDHAPGAHDDRANAVAGAVHLAQQKTTNPRVRGFDDRVSTSFFARLARAQQGQDVSGWG